ncbi:MAG: PqqD family peptide modification chaperone, partial [Pseudomonadota bacterium]
MARVLKTPSFRPSTKILFFPLVDGGVLFREGTRRLWVLNHTAAIIWCLLDQTTDLQELITQFSQGLSVDRTTAARDVALGLEFFEREGLLGEDTSTVLTTRDEVADFVRGPEIGASLQVKDRYIFRIGGPLWGLCCENTALAEDYITLMGHLAINNKGISPDTSLWVLPDPGKENSWSICIDGRVAEQGVPSDRLLPHLLTLTFVSISHAMADKLLFHAAVVKKGKGAILFPAAAGSGKTTLAAFLAMHGYTFFSDELAVLNVQDLTVLPCPLPMSIKSGSVKALSPYYPLLSQLTVYTRLDTKEVRYLPPPPDSLAQITDEAKVTAIVFPQFAAHANTRIVGLDKASALARLVQTGSSSRELRPVDISAMISVIEKSPCFELIFSDVEEAEH